MTGCFIGIVVLSLAKTNIFDKKEDLEDLDDEDNDEEDEKKELE